MPKKYISPGLNIYSLGLKSTFLCDLYFKPVHISNKSDAAAADDDNGNNNNNNNNNNQVMVKPLNHMCHCFSNLSIFLLQVTLLLKI